MRIALISTPFVSVPPKDYGGTELFIAELAEGLVAQGCDVTLFATGDSRSSAQVRSLYACAQWPPDPLTDMNHVSWSMRSAADEKFDVVHAHSASALAFSRFVGEERLVYTIHHARDEQLSRFYPYFPGVQYISISEDQRSREAPLEHIAVIHHGLDAGKYESTCAPADYVLFIGRFSRVKGPHTAIDAAESAGLPIRVAGEVHPPDAEFGAREMAPRLQRAHVRFLGLVGQAEKRPLLRDARALLAPIEWNEPFGLVLIEAMLSGCPVVAFGGGSVPEIVEPGLTGFIVESADEMAEVIRRGGPLDRFDREACRARAAQRFSRERMVRDHVRVYAEVCARAAGRESAPDSRADTGLPLCA